MDTITNKPGYKISDKELEEAFKELNISSSAPEEVETAPTTDLENPMFSPSDSDDDNDHETCNIVSSEQFTRCLPSNSVRSLALAYNTKTISLEAKNEAKNKANLVQQIAETAPTTDLENPTFSASDSDDDNDHETCNIVSSEQYKEWLSGNLVHHTPQSYTTTEFVNNGQCIIVLHLAKEKAETAPTTDLENPTFSASDGDNDNDHEIYDIVSSQQFKEWWCKNIFNNNDLNKETNELVIEEKFQEWLSSELDNYSMEPKEIECAGSDNIPTLEEIFDKLDSTPE